MDHLQRFLYTLLHQECLNIIIFGAKHCFTAYLMYFFLILSKMVPSKKPGFSALQSVHQNALLTRSHLKNLIKRIWKYERIKDHTYYFPVKLSCFIMHPAQPCEARPGGVYFIFRHIQICTRLLQGELFKVTMYTAHISSNGSHFLTARVLVY